MATQSRRGVAVGLGWRGRRQLCRGDSVQAALQKSSAAGRFDHATWARLRTSRVGSSAATQDSDSADGTRGRYSFFRGHCAFLLRRHGGALTTQRETTTPRPAGGIQSHKNFSPSRVNRPSASEDREVASQKLDCTDCNKYFLNLEKEEVPRRQVGGRQAARHAQAAPPASPPPPRLHTPPHTHLP